MVRSIFSLFLVFSMILISFPTNAIVTDLLIPGAVGTLDNPGDVRIEKFAEITSTDNEFKVTVTVEGKQKIDAAETDIVLVLDKSGSMAGSKMTAAKNTAKDFVNTLLPSGNTANRLGLVTFSDNASMVQALTNSAGSSSTGLIKAINDINTGGGTYIQKALVIAQDMLSSSTADHQYIVLLSDGAPTLSTQALTAVASSDIPGLSFKLTSFNSTKLGGSGTSYIIHPPYNVSGYSVGNHGIPTLSQALIVKDADIEIFSIGFGLSGTTNNATAADATWVLQNIANNGNYYAAADAEDLIDAFNSIAGDIIAPVKNGIVTDPIGQMYTYVPGSADASQGSAVYDNSTKTLTWTLGTVPEGVQATMTYHLQMNVTDPLFESDVKYPLNGTTTLAFTNVDGQSDSTEFLLPRASGKAAPIPVTLTTSVVGSGTIDPTAGDHDYAPDTTATVTATPASGWEFDRWNDADGFTVPNASGEVLMDVDRKVEAIFKEIINPPADVTLTTSVVGSGTISPAAGDHDYAPGTTATVTATPASGWEFDRWNDADGFTVPNASGEVQMDMDRKVEAIFKGIVIPPEPVTLTTSVVGSGTIDPTPGDHDYTLGATATITASPASGWEFDRWNDAEGFTVPDGSGKVLMDADKKVEAIFNEIELHEENVTLTTSISGSGSVNPSTGDHDYSVGTSVTVTANPASGWKFDRWNNAEGFTVPDTSGIVVMDADKKVEAIFRVIERETRDRDRDPVPDPDPGKISIFKFLDSNESRDFDSNEFPMANIVFHLYNEAMVKMETAATGDDGMIVFNNLEPGTYFVQEARQNYTITTPGFDDDGYYEVDVAEDETVLIEVGNYRETVPVDPAPLGPPIIEDIVSIEEEDVPLALPQTGEIPPYSAYAIGSLMILAGVFMKRKFI